MAETKEEQQLKREALQISNGVTRYHRNKESTPEADSKPGQTLVDEKLEKFIVSLEELVALVESGKAGRGHSAIHNMYLPHLQAMPVAYITTRVIVNALDTGARTSTVAMRIATLIEENYQFDELRTAEPALARNMEEKAKKWSTARHKRQIMRVAAEAAGVTGLEWSMGDKLKLGMKLIELFIETTNLCEEQMVSEGKNNTPKILRPTPETGAWLERQHERCSLLEPVYLPMLVPPLAWSTPLDGGYLTRENSVDFITKTNAEMRDDVFSMDMSDVYSAVNSVQATPWKINRGVFDVFSECWNAQGTLGGLPDRDDLDLPVRPDDIPPREELTREDMSDEMKARFDSWRQATAKAHDLNASLISKRIQMAGKLSMASGLLDEPEFYFPHNVDFRGRLYSVVPNLNPQADDVGKALLLFAEGKPLGETGGYWLAVHIANLFGVDKVSFDDRVEWTMENSDAIIESANDPLDGQRFWCEADDPWCALAACFEWSGFHSDGDDYVSHLPIAMDGSCSGIQHFSAMLRDRDGGMAVNLLPVDKPADIYTEVKERTQVLLQESGEPLGLSWSDNLTRKIVKRPCMTFAYSVTSRGMRDQILDEIRKQAEGDEFLPGTSNYMAATFLAPYVETAIKDTVDRAAEAMDWLKGSVRAIIESGCPVSWATPDGFPVQHRYMKSNGKRFWVWFQGTRVKVQLRIETKNPDLRKQQAAIAPNYVHSMDATHLRMVVNRMRDGGVTNSFAMIHDSFGCHACDIDELHFAIRDEFIKLYSANRLNEFRERVLAVLPEEEHERVEQVPESGELDLEEIRNAEFFFS